MEDSLDALKNPSLMTMIEPFNGSKVSEFFRTLEEIAILGQWTKPQILSILKLKIVGTARQFYNTSIDGKGFTYDIVKSKICERFKHTENFQGNFKQFSDATQLPHESSKDFALRLEGLAHQSFGEKAVGKENMSEGLRSKFILSQFLAGLQPRIKAQVTVADPSDFESAIQTAERIEEAQSLLTTNIHVVQNEGFSQNLENEATGCPVEVSALNLLCKQIEKLTERLEKCEMRNETQNQPSRNGMVRPPLACFFCNKPGHFMRDCRARLAQQGNQRRWRNENNSYGRRPQNPNFPKNE